MTQLLENPNDSNAFFLGILSYTSVVSSDSAPADLHTPFGPLQERYSERRLPA